MSTVFVSITGRTLTTLSDTILSSFIKIVGYKYNVLL